MLKLMNISTHELDLSRFDPVSGGLTGFLKKHQLDGVEVIQYGPWQPSLLNEAHIKGFHMKFWPIWLDFWKGNEAALLKEFDNRETVREYYGGETPATLVEQYREELQTAVSMGAKYAVFHVSHVSLQNCFDYAFEHEHEAVVEAFIDLMNQVLSPPFCLPEGFLILLENQWWPGLTLQHGNLARRLIHEIDYPEVGFMLDIGHLMNANLSLRTEEEAVSYILEQLNQLGSVKDHIYGVHLSSSLSGSYLENNKEEAPLYNPSLPFFERYFNAFGHIGQIDRHQVFEHEGINEIIECIQPRFLVLEFMTATLEEAEDMIGRQLAVLNYQK